MNEIHNGSAKVRTSFPSTDYETDNQSLPPRRPLEEINKPIRSEQLNWTQKQWEAHLDALVKSRSQVVTKHEKRSRDNQIREAEDKLKDFRERAQIEADRDHREKREDTAISRQLAELRAHGINNPPSSGGAPSSGHAASKETETEEDKEEQTLLQLVALLRALRRL